jgi:hypothetical protein
MAFHPQTNGLAEHANQKLKQLLRLLGTNQNEWANALPLLTLVYNNSRNSITGYSLNQLLTGRDPEITLSVAAGSDNPTAKLRVDQLRERRQLATHALNELAWKHTPTSLLFKPGQKVWLKAKNLALPYGSVKLAP